MRNILTISKRELTRLRSRVGGNMRATFLALAVGALALSARQQPLVVGAGLYRVGITRDAPGIRDSKFTVVVVDSAGGRTWLAQPAIDVFVDGTQALKRDDNKSLFAAGALQRYLEQYETARVNAEFDLGRAFPLRVESNYFGSTDTTTAPSNSDAAVREQIREAESGALPQIKSVTDEQIVVPSLTAPPSPFGQVVLAFIYIMPVFLVSVFFTSGFMDEKTNRKLTMLLSAPITPFQIIVGKMLPYVTFSLIGVIVISVLTHGDSPRALLIFTPAVLFIFGIYLMVPMLYRTFKDTTFVSMLATAVTTAYLIVPAMFSGISDLAYISPITLAV